MTMWRLHSYALSRARACFCFRSPVPMMTRPAEPQLLMRRVASHPAGDAALSTDQATWLQSVMPTPRSIYIRRGSSSQMTLRCPATVILTERFQDHLSDNHFDPHFPYRRETSSPSSSRCPEGVSGAETLLQSYFNQVYCCVRRQTRRYHASSVRRASCLDLPGLHRLGDGTRLPNSLVILT